MLNLSKKQLDSLSTLVGLTAGISTVLMQQGYLSDRLGGTIAGISVVLLGYLTNKPATARPTTEDLEERLTR